MVCGPTCSPFEEALGQERQRRQWVELEPCGLTPLLFSASKCDELISAALSQRIDPEVEFENLCVNILQNGDTDEILVTDFACATEH